MDEYKKLEEWLDIRGYKIESNGDVEMQNGRSINIKRPTDPRFKMYSFVVQELRLLTPAYYKDYLYVTNLIIATGGEGEIDLRSEYQEYKADAKIEIIRLKSDDRNIYVMRDRNDNVIALNYWQGYDDLDGLELINDERLLNFYHEMHENPLFKKIYGNDKINSVIWLYCDLDQKGLLN